MAMTLQGPEINSLHGTIVENGLLPNANDMSAHYMADNEHLS